MAKHELELCELTNMCMIINEEGKVLVQVRDKETWKGISFPGGHVEFGEAIVPSVIREIKEETNLDISNLSTCGIKDWYDYEKNKRYIVFMFKTNTYSGTLLERSDEGENKWMSIEEIYASNNLASGFKETLDVFTNKDNACEFFYDNYPNNEWKKIIY